MKLSKIFSAVFAMLTLFVGIGIAQLGNDWKPTTGETWQRTSPDGSTHNYSVLYSPSSVRRSGSVVSADMETIFVDSTPNVVYGMQFNCSTRQYTFAGYDLSVNPPVLGQVSVWKDTQPNTTGATLLPFFCRYQQTAAPVPYGLKLTSYKTVANLDYHAGFTVDAPVELKYQGQESSKTNDGANYTSQSWLAELPNGDMYYVGVSTYPFTVDGTSMAKTFANDFAGGVKGEVKSTHNVTVSGLPAVAAVIEATVSGKAMRFGVLVVVRGNKVFAFAFGTDLAAPGTNTADVETFFKSAALN